MPKPSSSPQPNPTLNAGYRAHHVNEHGTTLTIYNAKEAGIDAGKDRWAVSCETHGAIITVRTLARARASMLDADFCDECNKQHDSTEQQQ